MRRFDKSDLQAQYSGMGNYKNRIDQPLLKWYAGQYRDGFDLRNVDEILEVGCGDGSFWKYVVSDTAFTPHVFITDFAELMLAACKENLSGLSLNVEYQTVDIDALPFAPGTFNAVLAHKVIYHAENPVGSIAGIKRVLKRDGFFGVSVLNDGVYRPIWKLASELNDQISDSSLSANFNNIHADATLPDFFPEIEMRTYFSTKTFVDPEKVVEFVRTNPNVQPLKLSENFFSLFREKVVEIVEEKGKIECDYNSNLYLCRNGNSRK